MFNPTATYNILILLNINKLTITHSQTSASDKYTGINVIMLARYDRWDPDLSSSFVSSEEVVCHNSKFSCCIFRNCFRHKKEALIIIWPCDACVVLSSYITKQHLLHYVLITHSNFFSFFLTQSSTTLLINKTDFIRHIRFLSALSYLNTDNRSHETN